MDIRRSNGHRRRQLCAQVLREETHCHICGTWVDKALRSPHPMSPSVDELIPMHYGGSPIDRANTRLAHRVCNQCRSIGTHRGFCPKCKAQKPREEPQPRSYVTTRQWA